MKKRAKVTSSAPATAGCAIVGVGASAGGLEAFTQLLTHLPTDTGFGFVLVQHLDPQHPSALPQLLSRATEMPVLEAKNNLLVKANHVYIIPPNTSLGIVGGELQIRPRSPEQVAPRSIDNFLEALARDQAERAIGVILSGSATDGTLGLEAIRAAGGLTFAQDDSARFPSMPRSAVAAGCVDFVLSPEAIAKELGFVASHPLIANRSARARADARSGKRAVSSKGSPEEDSPLEDAAYRKIIFLLRNQSGVDFSLYKRPTLERRITRRAVLNRRNTLAQYAEFLVSNTTELDTLYLDALINVTSFFRNAEAFEVLRKEVFPALTRTGGEEPLRVWVLGCSTGQEAYSIAMAYAEATENIPRARRLQIFATDLNEINLEKARHGLYAKSLVADVSPERLRRFFIEEEGGYRVIKPVREQVVFARHNLISDPPFSRMDLISCRNVLIYLEASLQQRVLPALHYALRPKGYLFLGASESIGSFTNLFEPIDKKHKVFQRKAAATLAVHLPLWGARTTPPQVPPGRTTRGVRVTAPRIGEVSAEREADRITVNRFAPPSVLIDADNQILQFRGQTGTYLEPATGKATLDLLKMARPGLLVPLRAGVERAKMEDGTVRLEELPYKLNGQPATVTVEIVPLKNLEERRFLVLFEDPNRHPSSSRWAREASPVSTVERIDESRLITSLEQDLAEARDYLQSVQEYQEAANDELQASHEEGQSANEELQSLNEELETSKEELESTNEELTTVNEEMASRNLELNRLNSDLTNLLTSAKLVVVLLGRDLTIRRFSAQAEQQFSLGAGDLGRPITGIRHQLVLTDLEALIRGVIRKGRESEREVQDVNGRWHSLRVRPYLTSDNEVDGAVFLLMDINASKLAEHEVVRARDFAEAVIGTVRDPLLILNGKLQVQQVNDAFLKTFRTRNSAVIGQPLFSIVAKQLESPELRSLLLDILAHHTAFDNFEVTRTFPRIGRRTFVLNARMLSQDPGHTEKILLGFLDITERKRSEDALVKAQQKLAAHAGQLTTTVARRTRQLTLTNTRLAESLATTRAGEVQNHALLLESQAMQQKLRQLTHQILTAQEEERKQISRELHDEVVQSLVGINIALSSLMQGDTSDAKVLKDRIARTKRVVESAVDAVHRFARELRPAVLDDLGLIPALRAYCKTLGAQHQLRIQLTAFSGVERLDSDKRTAMFRVATEALTNVAKHAHATRVTLTIAKTAKGVRMQIRDNGKAFMVGKPQKSKTLRLGIVGMRERIEMVGGALTIESSPGKGTTVRADIPAPLARKQT